MSLDQVVADRNEQRRNALEKAREVRSQRGRLRQALKARQLNPYEVLEGRCDPLIEGIVKDMKLRELLPMLPGIGKARALEVIVAFDASPETRIGLLTEERRQQLSWIVKGAREAFVEPGVDRSVRAPQPSGESAPVL